MTTKETVLDIIDTVRNRNDTCQYTASLIQGFVRLIDDEPILPQGKNGDGWIPVSERLPEAGKTVLIVHEGETVPGYRLPSNLTNDEDVNDFDIGDEVVSSELWQHLPNPPTSHK